MKAALMQDIGEISVEQIDAPKLDPAGALLRLEACGICGTDARTFFNSDHRAPTPWLLGHEPVGIVEEVGRQAELPAGVIRGTRVFFGSILTCGRCRMCLDGKQNLCEREELYGYDPHPGAYAELAAVPPIGMKNLFPLSPELPSDLATVADPLACALNGIEILAPRYGDTVVVMGSGPVGCMQVALLRERGVGRIILLEVNAPRLELALTAVGDLVDDAWVPEADNGVAGVLERTGGRGAESIIVAAPSGAGQQAALVMAAAGAHVVYFGGLPKTRPTIEFDSNQLHYKELAVLGAYGATPRQYRVTLDLLARRRELFSRLVTLRVSLDDIATGFAAIREGTALKVVVTP